MDRVDEHWIFKPSLSDAYAVYPDAGTNMPNARISNILPLFLSPLHPQTQLSTSSTSSDPIFRLMELRHRRNSSNTITSELSQLLSIACIHVDEAIHISDDEALDVVRGLELPLRAKTVGS